VAFALFVKRTPVQALAAGEAKVDAPTTAPAVPDDLRIDLLDPGGDIEPPEAYPAETPELLAEDGEASWSARQTATAPEGAIRATARSPELSYEAQRARIRAQLDDSSPPGAHAGTPGPPGGKDLHVSIFDGGIRYGELRAQIAGWDKRLITGTYKPGGSRIAHPDEMPSERVPASVVASVVRSSAGRFHVCHGAGLPGSAGVSGEVVVAFTIETDGRVTNARDAGGVFPDDAVRRCIVRAVTQLSFQTPPLGLAQEVTLPIALQAEEATGRPDLHGTSDAPP
jgi:TonB family protein